MSKNYLLEYSEQLATEIELLCQNKETPSANVLEVRESSIGIYVNILESKMQMALCKCDETKQCLEFLNRTTCISDEQYKCMQNTCDQISRMIIYAITTMEDKNGEL